jgi:hypothetical protein
MAALHNYDEDSTNGPLEKNVIWNDHLIKNYLPAITKRGVQKALSMAIG